MWVRLSRGTDFISQTKKPKSNFEFYIYIYLLVTHHISWLTIFFGISHSQGTWRICYLQVLKDFWCHFTTDVSLFRPYAETMDNGSDRKVCVKWLQFRSWFRPCSAKVWSFLIQRLSCYFSLTFNVSVDFVGMFVSCFVVFLIYQCIECCRCSILVWK